MLCDVNGNASTSRHNVMSFAPNGYWCYKLHKALLTHRSPILWKSSYFGHRHSMENALITLTNFQQKFREINSIKLHCMLLPIFTKFFQVRVNPIISTLLCNELTTIFVGWAEGPANKCTPPDCILDIFATFYALFEKMLNRILVYWKFLPLFMPYFNS